MQSKRFGVAWIVHQTLPLYANESLKRGDMAAREALLLSMHALAQVLPCKFCRRSYRQFVGDVQLDRRLQHMLGDTLQFFGVLFDLHNLVNAKLDKPRASSLADYLVAESVDQFRCALLDWLCMLATNYSKFAVEQNHVLREMLARAVVAVRERTPSEWLRQAMLRNVSLLDYVDQMAEQRQRTLDPSLADAWRKVWWHVVYFDALLRLMQSSGEPLLVQCGRALRNEMFGNDDEQQRGLDGFGSAESMFRALYNVRRQCAWPDGCESYAALKRRFESYRAGACKGQTCV